MLRSYPQIEWPLSIVANKFKEQSQTDFNTKKSQEQLSVCFLHSKRVHSEAALVAAEMMGIIGRIALQRI